MDTTFDGGRGAGPYMEHLQDARTSRRLSAHLEVLMLFLLPLNNSRREFAHADSLSNQTFLVRCKVLAVECAINFFRARIRNVGVINKEKSGKRGRKALRDEFRSLFRVSIFRPRNYLSAERNVLRVVAIYHFRVETLCIYSVASKTLRHREKFLWDFPINCIT